MLANTHVNDPVSKSFRRFPLCEFGSVVPGTVANAAVADENGIVTKVYKEIGRASCRERV